MDVPAPCFCNCSNTAAADHTWHSCHCSLAAAAAVWQGCWVADSMQQQQQRIWQLPEVRWQRARSCIVRASLCHPAAVPLCLPALQPPGQASQPQCCFHSGSHPSRRWQHSKTTSATAASTCMPATCSAASTSCSRCSCPSGCSRQQCLQKQLRRWAGRQTRECALSKAASGLKRHSAVDSGRTACLLCCTLPEPSSQDAQSGMEMEPTPACMLPASTRAQVCRQQGTTGLDPNDRVAPHQQPPDCATVRALHAGAHS